MSGDYYYGFQRDSLREENYQIEEIEEIEEKKTEEEIILETIKKLFSQNISEINIKKYILDNFSNNLDTRESINSLLENELKNLYKKEYLLLNFFWNQPKYIPKSEKTILEEEKRESDIIKLISGFNTQKDIKEKTIKKLLEDNLEYMMFTYANKESLSYDYIYISKQKECLKILIKSILKENNYTLNSTIIYQIEELIKKIYDNIDKLIVYDRVALVQKFIHQKVDEKNGINAHLLLSKKLMKDILSTARLHLNLRDIQQENLKSLIFIIKKSEKISTNKITDKNKMRDFKSLIDFGYFNISKKIVRIYNLNEETPIEKFKKQVISIYRKSYFSINTKVWQE